MWMLCKYRPLCRESGRQKETEGGRTGERRPFLSLPFFLSFFQIREIAVLRHNFEQRNWVEKQLREGRKEEFIEYLCADR